MLGARAEIDAVHALAVVEPSAEPTPRKRPPITDAPRMVALTETVEVDLLVADQYLAVNDARALRSGSMPVG